MGKFKNYCHLFKCFCNSMKTLGVGLVFLCIILLTASPVVSAMTVLSDGEMATLHGGMGTSIELTGTARITVDSFVLWDTDSKLIKTSTLFGDNDIGITSTGIIEFKNIVWDDGSGGSFSFATPAGDPATFDIGTNAAGHTLINIHDPTQWSPRTFASDLIFCGQPLGSLKISDIVRTENNLIIGAHGGLDFELKEKTAIGYAQYQYNTQLGDNPNTVPVETDYKLGTLTATGIHLSGTASGSLEGNPNDWTYSGPFKIGDIVAGANPAQLDVGTDASGVTSMRYELPMAGSIRVENVTFGGSDFGPLALDGLNVHHLALQFHP